MRTLFIGLDGFTFHVLDRLTAPGADGEPIMPFLGSLLGGGFGAKLRSTPHPLTPPAWVTLMTGVNPGRHGVYDFMRVRDVGNEVLFTLYDSRDIQSKTIWSIASEQGRSVVALNFPIMAPPPAVNGSLIPGFTSARHLARNSHPKGLFERFKAIPGFDAKALAWDFERENEIGEEMDADYLARWIGYHLPREQMWYEAARLLLTEDQPDLMAVMLDGADKIQHQAWQYIDPDLTPDAPDADYRRLRELCDSYYRRLDGYIAGLVQAAGPDTQVFLASDHGFCTTTKVFRVNRLLADLGHLVYREVPDTDEGARRAKSPFAFLDWERTVAYCPTPSSNGICIRVARAPGEPGIALEDYDAFRERLIGELRAVLDPATGAPIVRNVLRREEAFPGAQMAQAPDLTLELSDHGFVSIRNLEPVIVERNWPAGTHHPDGVFIAAGAGIVDGVRGERLQIADVAATLLYSLGLPVPEDLDGSVALSCFTDTQLGERPVQRGPAVNTDQPSAGPAAGERADERDADKQKILDQLAMLGYLEE